MNRKSVRKRKRDQYENQGTSSDDDDDIITKGHVRKKPRRSKRIMLQNKKQQQQNDDNISNDKQSESPKPTKPPMRRDACCNHNHNHIQQIDDALPLPMPPPPTFNLDLPINVNNDQQNEWDNLDFMNIKCTKCNKPFQTYFNESQREYIESYTCIKCNDRAGKEQYKWKCKHSGCNNNTWLTLKGFIKHFDKKCKKGDHEHLQNDAVYGVFDIKPCKNEKCTRYIKTTKHILFKFDRLDRDYDGYCASCNKLNILDDLKSGQDQLGIFNDIDSIHLLSVRVHDKIPRSVIYDFSELMGYIYNKINKAQTTKERELYVKLRELAPKVILAKSNRGDSKENEDKLMIEKIKAFRCLDFSKILNYLCYIVKDNEENNAKLQVRQKKYDEMDDCSKQLWLDNVRVKRMQKYIDLNDWSKAYKQAEYKPNMQITEEIVQKFQDKLISNDVTYDQSVVKYIPGIYHNHSVDDNLVDKVLSKMNNGAIGGVDRMDVFIHQQLYDTNNDTYKRSFRKYLERIMNGKCSEYELINNSVSIGLPIPKKQPGEIRPLTIGSVLMRIANVCGLMLNIIDVTGKQLQSQYGINKKNAINIIVHSFDMIMEYIKQINGQYLDDKKEEEKHELTDIVGQNGISCTAAIDFDLLNTVLNSDKYCFGDDDVINDNILNLMKIVSSDIDSIIAFMKDDMQNCFGRIARYPSLRNIRENIPGLYNLAYANYGYPTKIVIGGKILYQKDGMGQGNVITGICLLINESDIHHIMQQLLSDANIDCIVLCEMNYWDDSNKAGSIRSIILNHLLKQKIGMKYNNKYRPDKTELILSHEFDALDESCVQYIKSMQLKVLENGEYEILGIKRGCNAFNHQMVEKMERMKNKCEIVDKLENHKQKYQLFSNVAKLESLTFYIQCMDQFPEYDEINNELVINQSNNWIDKATENHDSIIHKILKLSLPDHIKKLFTISRNFGGLALRSIKNLLAPAYISGIHKIVKNIWSELDVHVIYHGNNTIKNNIIRAIDHNNNNTLNKFKTTVDEVYHELDIINRLSMADNDDINKENMIQIEQLLIDNNIVHRNKEKSDNTFVLEDREQQQHMISSIKNKLSMKSLVYGIESKIYHNIFAEAPIDEKIRMNARRSDKCMAFLNNYLGEDFDNSLDLNNQQFDNIIRLMYGLKIIDSKSSIDCKRCSIDMDCLCKHTIQCKKGLGPKWMHDEFNKYLYRLLNEELNNVQLEIRPADQDNRQLPDIIIHDNVVICEQTKIMSTKLYLDTIIYDIYRQEHKSKIEKGEYSIFSAGKLGESEKYRIYQNRFENLRSKGYKFKPIALESFGGISKSLKQIINVCLKSKSDRTGKSLDILRNNYYIKLSMWFKKMMIKRLYDHVDIV